MGHLILLTAPQTQRTAGDAAQVIRPVGGREAGVSVARCAAPLVAVTGDRSTTKNANASTMDIVALHEGVRAPARAGVQPGQHSRRVRRGPCSRARGGATSNGDSW